MIDQPVVDTIETILEDFEAAWAEGQTLSLSQAITEALAV